ncbi:hypothetical protein FNO19_21480 [Salmonella enterica subsp. salamae]|nr:hypothetical protein [Salmonella enterica subsp. salamae]
MLPVSCFFMVSWSATEADQGERFLPHFRPALTSLPAAQALLSLREPDKRNAIRYITAGWRLTNDKRIHQA